MHSFPQGFFWGAATAAHQVEGQSFNNDWWDWEQLPGKIKRGDSAHVACDWWGGGRWREDFDCARALGMNAQRVSLEWSRIEPRQGEWDDTTIAFYRELLQGLHARGMEPFVTLWHFTLPRWAAAQGGFENPNIVQWLARFADKCAREFGDLVRFWITLNEPNIYAAFVYLRGEWLVQKRDPRAMGRALRNMIRAHANMYHALKRARAEFQVGLANQWVSFEPARPDSFLDRVVARLRSRVVNELVPEAVFRGQLVLPLGLNESIPEARGAQDFFGLNYYYQDLVRFDLSNPGEGFSRSVFTPETEALHKIFAPASNINAPSFQRVLQRVAQYRLPIYIFENGIFDAGGDFQTRYLITHLQAMHNAMQNGADVRGYFWWTLVDNFEWAEGYAPRFGLVHLDLETQTRTPKPVADAYAQIIRTNGIPDELLKESMLRSHCEERFSRRGNLV